MKDQNVSEEHDGTKNEMNETWEPPEILEYGVIEARLFSDEPDPWGGP